MKNQEFENRIMEITNQTVMTTEQLISEFEFQNGNPIVDITIDDNGDTITINLEGVASQEFPKPGDFNTFIRLNVLPG